MAIDSSGSWLRERGSAAGNRKICHRAEEWGHGFANRMATRGCGEAEAPVSLEAERVGMEGAGAVPAAA